MNPKPYASLAVLVAYLALSFCLKTFTDQLGLSYRGYYLLAHSLGALTVVGLLSLREWDISLRSQAKPLPSLFFSLGAYAVVTVFSAQYFHILGEADSSFANKQAVGGDFYPMAGIAYAAIASLLIAPIKEEIIFRMGLFESLVKLMGKPLALVLSSLIFASSHIGRVPMQALLPYVFAGIVLGLTYMVLGLPWSIFAHFLINLMPFMDSRGFLDKIFSNDASFLGYCALSLVGLCTFVYLLFITRKSLFKGHSASTSIHPL